MKKRVVITGYGTINSVGNNVEETWEKLIAGESGIELIKAFDTTDYSSKIGAEIKDFDITKYFTKKRVKRMDRYAVLSLVAAKEAYEHSGLDKDNFDSSRAGIISGSGIGGIHTLEEEHSKLIKKGPRRVSPFFIPKMISNIAPAEISIEYKLKGPNYNVVSACAAANHAIGSAFRTIQYGDADIMFTGGGESAVTPLSLAGFCNMKALSTRNDDPKKASRPFDKERDGFIIGEGAGMLVLEELEHAKSRGANIIAEIVGFGSSADAFHITAPAANGEGGKRAMKAALKDAGIKPEQIDYINAHGTSTPLNDKNETQAIKDVFGTHAKNLHINSTKSMVGHTLGAAAAIEAIVCCKSIQTGILHPSINIEIPDPDCDLNYVPHKFKKKEINYALSNALGFGGQNGVLILKRYQ
ncbi:MAG: beta-ketoacyl-ACP synthase II [Candidatus Cloacimonadota bacterium]|nr:beta-ketoacyl-ACP synthase II [Candidatus Cloacimonadota bacterium]